MSKRFRHFRKLGKTVCAAAAAALHMPAARAGRSGLSGLPESVCGSATGNIGTPRGLRAAVHSSHG